MPVANCACRRTTVLSLPISGRKQLYRSTFCSRCELPAFIARPALTFLSIASRPCRQQRHPNYAPNAAPPLLPVKDVLVYESYMNPAVCRGTSLMENCMLDRFSVPVTTE